MKEEEVRSSMPSEQTMRKYFWLRRCAKDGVGQDGTLASFAEVF